jgi:AmiR/NasT family two-component response regulator
MNLRVLIVEDEVLLAMELESELEDAGHLVIGHAMSRGDVMSILARSQPDFAFVDIHLQDGPSGIEIGSHLATIGVPYVFMTGNVKRIPDDFAGAWGAIEKPYSAAGFRNALDYLTRRLKGMEDDANTPPSLKLPDNLARVIEA